MIPKPKKDDQFMLDDGIEEATKLGLKELLKKHVEQFKGIKRLPTMELMKSKLWNNEGHTHFRVIDKHIMNNDILKFYVMLDYTRVIGKDMPMKGWFAQLAGKHKAIDYDAIPLFVLTAKPEYVFEITHQGGLIEYKIIARTFHQNPKYRGTEYGEEFDMLAMEVKKREHEVEQRESAIALVHTATSEAGQLDDLKDSRIDRRIERKMKQEAKITEFQQRPMQPQQQKTDEAKT